VIVLRSGVSVASLCRRRRRNGPPSCDCARCWLRGTNVPVFTAIALAFSWRVTASVHDGRAGGSTLPADPTDVNADSAYRGEVFAGAVRSRGGVPRVVATHMWGREGDDTLRKLRTWNDGIQRIRCRIEKIFGTWKRSYGLRRMRWRGLAKAALQVRLTAIAYNLKRTVTIMWSGAQFDRTGGAPLRA
jgi:hypothetical protein